MRPDRLALPLLMALALSACAGSSAMGGPPKARQVDAERREAAVLQVKLGQGYLTEGDLGTARDKLQRALELDPGSVDAHTLMAVLNERINRPNVAESFYRRATELKPEDGAVNNNYGAFLCTGGRFAEAEPYFGRAISDPFYRTPEVAYTNAALCAIKAGFGDKAEGYLRSALDIQPRNAVALFELARIQFAKGDLLRARAFLQRYEAMTPDGDPEALDLGARIEERAGAAAAAAAYRRRLQEQFPLYVPNAENEESRSP
ncbi:MAG: type IV pilus biogenesis/stability protein PilW [Lysobacteraceae bacterium]